MKLKFWGNEHMCQKSRKLGGEGAGGHVSQVCHSYKK